MTVQTLQAPVPGAALDCGHQCPPRPHTGATGYARDASGATLCYPCADAAHRAELLTADRTGAYLSSDGRMVTTWTGGHLGRVTAGSVARGWTPTGGSYDRHTVHVVDVHGTRWIGRGPGEGMYLRLVRAAGN